ncbi:MAG: hypothetical protein ACRCSB_01145 [Bacteroidales bacterium]
MQKNIYHLLCGFAILMLGACSTDVFFDSRFIPDEENENLPKATQLGYNTAGAFFDIDSSPRSTWLISSHFATANTVKLYADGPIVTFSLSGFIASQGNTATIEFEILNTTSIRSLFGLQSLSNQLFTTTNGNLLVKSIAGNSATNYNPIIVNSASIQFDDCKRLYIKSELQGVCASGKFELEGRAEGEKFSANVQIQSGRFDMLFKRYDNGQFTL